MESSFDFKKYLNFIEQTGKKLYNPNFKIYPEDHEIIFKLLVYFLQDKNSAEKLNISHEKGILLNGPVGCGKTSLMNILRYTLPQQERYVLKSCRDLSFEFIQDGYSVIHKYSKLSFKDEKPRTYCFDDLGTENNLKYFGNECNVMSEILLSRYDLFIFRKQKTHLTTNLNSTEIESMYGTRVRSRLREMFNLLAFPNTVKDKRY
jgi:DNA replication protein DnaC